MQTINFHSHRLVNMTLQLTNERLRCRETLEYCLGYKFRLLPPMQYRLRQIITLTQRNVDAMHADKIFQLPCF